MGHQMTTAATRIRVRTAWSTGVVASLSRLLPSWRRSSIVMVQDPSTDPEVLLVDSTRSSGQVVLSGKRLQALCARETLADAIAEATTLLLNVPVHSTELSMTSRPVRHVVSYRHADNGYTFLMLFESMSTGWRVPSGGRSRRQRRDHRKLQASWLTEALGRYQRSTTTIDQDVRTPYAATAGWEMCFRSALPLWWDERLNEGYTPEAARTMLSLIVDTRTLALLDFHGGAPSLLRLT